MHLAGVFVEHFCDGVYKPTMFVSCKLDSLIKNKELFSSTTECLTFKYTKRGKVHESKILTDISTSVEYA